MAVLVAGLLSCGVLVGIVTSQTAASASTMGGSITWPEVIARAMTWINEPPPGGYNENAYYTAPALGESYRTDCSGFVSMALHLSSSLTTSSIASSSLFTQISKSQLQPGDVLDAKNGNGSSYGTGHVVLFAGWTNAAQTSYTGYEFGTGTKPISRTIQYPYDANDGRTYLPYHYVNLTGSSPTSQGFETALQINTHDLWALGPVEDKDWKLGPMAGTSPSIAALASGGYEVAFQANTGDLWTVGAAGNTDWKLGMRAGTSPSITSLTGGGFEVAFQANTGSLWTVGSAGNKNWGAGMDSASSPSITSQPNNGYEVALQINTHDLWTLGTTVSQDWHLGPMAGTSPSITSLTGGGFEVAFQANTGSLWTVGSAGNTNWGAGMDSASSPSITT